MKAQLDINDKEIEELIRILEKQAEKTEWVVNNKDPDNADFLEKRIDLMEKIVTQLKEQLGIPKEPESDSLDIDDI